MNDFQLSQTELSLSTGVPQPTIHRFMNGKTKSPNYEVARKIANYFDVSVDYLHGYGTVADKPRISEE
tara:strand:+ start:537 stop:740 length:204 start_codon:yes stop_codon:yes gene_type:complete